MKLIQILSDYAENEMCSNKIDIKNAIKMITNMPSEITMCKNCQYFKLVGNDPLLEKQFGRCSKTANFCFEGKWVYENDYCVIMLKKILKGIDKK